MCATYSLGSVMDLVNREDRIKQSTGERDFLSSQRSHLAKDGIQGSLEKINLGNEKVDEENWGAGGGYAGVGGWGADYFYKYIKL